MRVVYFHRKPALGCYSVESYFASVRRHLPSDVEGVVAESRYFSRGLLPRAYNVVEAALRQGDVNHITGEVQFLDYLMRRQRTLLTILDCAPLHRTTGVRRAVLKTFWYDLPALRAAEITVISESVKDDLLNWCSLDANRVHVVPVHIAEQYQAVPGRDFDGHLRILQVGTAPNKNIERLARAIEGLDCHLDCVGRLSGSQRDELVRAGVRFSEHVAISDEALLKLYVDAHLVAFVSTVEGFGMPILEANAVGRPVVTSNVSSMPEVAGKAACLVDPLDVDAIRAGVLKIAGSREYRESLVAAGFENASRYRVENIVAAYVELYRKLGHERA